MHTEQVKNILQSECSQAAYSLKPWSVERTVITETNASICTCPERVSSQEEIEEIAAGISRTLLQSQQLREKLSTNISKAKRISKQPSVTEIYSNAHVTGDKRHVPKTSELQEKSKPGKIRIEKTESPKEIVPKSSLNALKSSTSIVQSRKPKNFLALNKQYLRNPKIIDRQKKSRSVTAKTSNTIEPKPLSVNKENPTASTSELKTLIDKMSIESNPSSSITFNEHINNCPVHGNVSPTYVEERVSTTMDVIEALDRFNIPGEIIKALKIYHQYLNNKFSDNPTGNTKCIKSRNKFLGELEKMNQSVSKKVLANSELPNTFNSTLALYEDTFHKNKSANITGMKRIKREIKAFYDKCDIDDFSVTKFRGSNGYENFYDADFSSRWMSNGIWNYSSIKSLEGMTGTCCIRYSDTSQLLSLLQAIQDLQETQYLDELIKVLLRDVIPLIKTHFDPTKKEYIRVYKMIHIVCQGLNPTIPVLVRTDT